MTIAADKFRELLHKGVCAMGGLQNTPEGRQKLQILAEQAMWNVNSETIDHLKILVAPGRGRLGVAQIMFDALTLYGCDLLDMIFPEQEELINSMRVRLTAELSIIGQERTIH